MFLPKIINTLTNNLAIFVPFDSQFLFLLPPQFNQETSSSEVFLPSPSIDVSRCFGIVTKFNQYSKDQITEFFLVQLCKEIENDKKMAINTKNDYLTERDTWIISQFLLSCSAGTMSFMTILIY